MIGVDENLLFHPNKRPLTDDEFNLCSENGIQSTLIRWTPLIRLQPLHPVFRSNEVFCDSLSIKPHIFQFPQEFFFLSSLRLLTNLLSLFFYLGLCGENLNKLDGFLHRFYIFLSFLDI